VLASRLDQLRQLSYAEALSQPEAVGEALSVAGTGASQASSGRCLQDNSACSLLSLRVPARYARSVITATGGSSLLAVVQYARQPKRNSETLAGRHASEDA
jgi:hypothetical protein